MNLCLNLSSGGNTFSFCRNKDLGRTLGRELNVDFIRGSTARSRRTVAPLHSVHMSSPFCHFSLLHERLVSRLFKNTKLLEELFKFVQFLLHFMHKTDDDLLIFLKNRKLSAGTVYFRFLIYLKAIYEQKMKKNDFSTLATKLRFWSIFPDRRS